jgi:hypothetical protein
MFTDPQTVTINAVAQVMPRVSSGDNKGSFSLPDGTYQLKFAHQYGKRTRRTVRLDNTKIAANPFDTTLNQRVGASVYLVVDVPANGQSYTLLEVRQMVEGFTAYLTTGAAGNIAKLLGGEN